MSARKAVGSARRSARIAGLLVFCCASCHSGASPAGGTNATPAPSADGRGAGGIGVVTVALAGEGGGAGFDDLVFASDIRKVLAPAGGAGSLDLVDPDTMQVTEIRGFSDSRGSFKGGHGEGTTSADEGDGLVFAIDRTSGLLDVVDPAAKAIVASAKLGGAPDYVRWVDPTHEIWVTEPDREVIEVFSVPREGKPTPVRSVTIPIKGGPESLVVDSTRKRAFTHLWGGSSVVVDVATHAVTATWPNGCGGSRGIAIDSKRGFLLAGCAEGKLVVLDIDHDGRPLGSVSSGAGVDVIAYSPALAHAYLPGSSSATMAFVGVASSGEPTVLGTVPTAAGAHCVAADDRSHAWVCDPDRGRLLLFKDMYPPSGS